MRPSTIRSLSWEPLSTAWSGGLEEERANGAAIDDEVINGIKLGLMGPLAGIGDAMVPGMLVPLLLSIAIGLSQGGSVVGPIFYIVTLMVSVTAASYYLFMKGYQLGTKSVNMIVGEAAQRVREAFNLLGGIVDGRCRCILCIHNTGS